MKKIEVVAAVLIKDHKVFIAQRKSNHKQGGKWEFPGGKIENGETHKEALKRELKEEFDVDVIVGDHITSVNHFYPDFEINLHAYRVKIIQGELKPNDHENMAWIEPKEMKDYDFLEADVPIVNQILNRKY